MELNGLEPATLGLRGGRWDLGWSRSSWKTSDLEPISGVGPRWTSVDLVAPLLPPRWARVEAEDARNHPLDCALRGCGVSQIAEPRGQGPRARKNDHSKVALRGDPTTAARGRPQPVDAWPCRGAGRLRSGDRPGSCPARARRLRRWR